MQVAPRNFYPCLNHNILHFEHTLVIFVGCRFFLLRHSAGIGACLCLVNNTRQQPIFVVSDSLFVQHEPGQQPIHLQEEDAADTDAGGGALPPVCPTPGSLATPDDDEELVAAF